MNAIPEVRICPLNQFLMLHKERQLPEQTAAILSSSDPLDAEKLRGVTYVFQQYDDVDQPIPGRALTIRQAEQFAYFLEHLEKNTEVIYCCCDGGMSRSAAVAAAVCRFYGQSEAWIWCSPHYHPNALVFGMLCEALRMPVSEYELERLVRRNRKAFSDAIKRAREGS